MKGEAHTLQLLDSRSGDGRVRRTSSLGLAPIDSEGSAEKQRLNDEPNISDGFKVK